jgi:hypothetical protein
VKGVKDSSTRCSHCLQLICLLCCLSELKDTLVESSLDGRDDINLSLLEKKNVAIGVLSAIE